MAGKTKNIKIDWFGDELLATVRKSGEPALWAAGQVLKHAAQGKAPSRSGTLRDSAFVVTATRSDYRKGRRDRRKVPTPSTPDNVVVGFAAWYGNLLEDSGATAHWIPYRGKTGKARVRKILRIQGRYFSGVNHPGMTRKPFLAPALEENKDQLGRTVAEKIGDALA